MSVAQSSATFHEDKSDPVGGGEMSNSRATTPVLRRGASASDTFFSGSSPRRSYARGDSLLPQSVYSDANASYFGETSTLSHAIRGSTYGEYEEEELEEEDEEEEVGELSPRQDGHRDPFSNGPMRNARHDAKNERPRSRTKAERSRRAPIGTRPVRGRSSSSAGHRSRSRHGPTFVPPHHGDTRTLESSVGSGHGSSRSFTESSVRSQSGSGWSEAGRSTSDARDWAVEKYAHGRTDAAVYQPPPRLHFPSGKNAQGIPQRPGARLMGATPTAVATTSLVAHQVRRSRSLSAHRSSSSGASSQSSRAGGQRRHEQRRPPISKSRRKPGEHDDVDEGTASRGSKSGQDIPPPATPVTRTLSAPPVLVSPEEADASALQQGRCRRLSPDLSSDEVVSSVASRRSQQHREKSRSETVASSLPATGIVDSAWALTVPLELHFILSQIRARIDWYRAAWEFIVLVPMLFLVSFYAVYHTGTIQSNLFVTEALRQLTLRENFPTTAASLETFRQQYFLDTTIAVPTDRLFAEIQNPNDWIQFVTDALLPRLFPGVEDVLDTTYVLPAECTAPGDSSSSSSLICFEDGIYHWDRPGCYDDSAASAEDDVLDVYPEGVSFGQSARTDGAASDASSTLGGDDTGTSPASTWDTSSSSRVPCKAEYYLLQPGMRVAAAGNILLGAMRLRTLRMRDHSARLQTSLYPRSTVPFPRDAWHRGHDLNYAEKMPMRCPSINLTNPFTNETTPLYTYSRAVEKGEHCVRDVGRFGSYECEGYTVEIPFRATSWLTAQYRAALRNPACLFLDTWATRLAVVEWFTYTPDQDYFHMVKYYTEVSTGGHYYNQAMLRSFPVWTPRHVGWLVYVCFCSVALLVYTIIFMERIVWHVRVYPWSALLVSYATWVDVAMITVVGVSYGYFFLWVRLSQQVAPALVLPLANDTYPAALDYVSLLFDHATVTAAFGVILCFTRLCFSGVLFRPLRTFLRAVELSAPTVLMVAGIFVVLVVGYALVGYAVFGPVSESFYTFAQAFFSQLRVWFSLALLFPSEEEVPRAFTTLYVLSFAAVSISFCFAASVAAAIHAFSRIQFLYGERDSELWMGRQLATLWNGVSWAQIKAFLTALSPRRTETLSLLELLFVTERAFRGRHDEQEMPSNGAVYGTRAAPSVGVPDLRRGQAENRHESDLLSHPHVLSGKDDAACAAELRSNCLGSSAAQLSALSSNGSTWEDGRSTSSAYASTAAQPVLASDTSSSLSRPYLDSGTGRYATVLRRTSDELHVLHAELRDRAILQPPITFFEWCRRMPPNVLDRCGSEEHLAAWWVEMVETQADAAQATDPQDRCGLRERVAAATEREVAAGLVRIVDLDYTLTQLEMYVESLLINVSKRMRAKFAQDREAAEHPSR